jgi:hypothetical protein
VAFDEAHEKLLLGKSLSTPDRLVDGIGDAAEVARATFRDVYLFLHGSTKANKGQPNEVIRCWLSER